MANANPFAALDPDYEPGSEIGLQSGTSSTSTNERVFPRLSSDQGPALYTRLLKWWRVASYERYVAHYYPQYSNLTGVARNYHLPLLLRLPRPQPALIRHYDLEVDLLPLTVVDDQYLLTSDLDEFGTWKSMAHSRGNDHQRTSVQWRRLIYNQLGRFPTRSTTQFKTLLNTLDELTLSLGHEVSNAKLLDTRPEYGHLFLAATASQLRYHGVQPNDVKRDAIHRLWSSIASDTPEPQLDETTILETTLPNNEYKFIYYEPHINPGDTQWSLTIQRELETLWPALADNGFLLLMLSDSREVNTAAQTNQFIEQHLYRSSYYGTIGMLEPNDTKANPIWIWSREPASNQ